MFADSTESEKPVVCCRSSLDPHIRRSSFALSASWRLSSHEKRSTPREMPDRFSKLMLYALALVVTVLSISTFANAQKKLRPEPLPTLLSVREQVTVRERWLKTRLDTMLLPMMRRHKIEMWIVTNEEFHPETVVPYIAPPIPYQGRRDFFIFADRGGDKLDRIALVRYPEEHLSCVFRSPESSGQRDSVNAA